MSQATSSPELIDQLDRFFRRYYHQDIAELANRYPRDQQSLWVDYQDIFKFDPDLADDFVSNPNRILEYFEEGLRNFDLPADIELSDAHVRVYNLPSSRTFQVGGYRSAQIDEYLAIEGQVSKKTEVHPVPTTAAFECKRCGTITQIPQSDSAEVDEPHECQGCERQGPFDLNRDRTDWKDLQLLRIQLPPEQSKGGDGANIDALLENDLTEFVDPGDRLTLSGHLTVDEPSNGDPGYVPKLNGHAVEVEESDFSTIDIEPYFDDIHDIAMGEKGDPYNLLVESIAPNVIGMEEIKEALALQLFGGVRVDYPDGTHTRGDIHVLLLGDPGTAKSTLLNDIERKAPCSTFASGKGATTAGMTASAVKDDFGGDSWTLEAGALVLADGGIACVDELDKVGEDVVSSMHDALSKQRIGINKAGINATLPSRTSLLAAGNPEHGRFIAEKPIADQIDLGPTLLSRFDLMFMLDDTPDEQQDSQIISGMVSNRQHAIEYTRDGSTEDFDDIEPEVDTDVLRAWVAYAKRNVFPRIEDDDVMESLEESFKTLRLVNGEDPNSPVPVTFRKLEAILRLAEASARVRLSDTVEMADVDRARRLVGRSMKDVGIDPDSGQLDVDVIETGAAMSQTERMEWLYEYIRRNEGEDPVAYEDVSEAAFDTGFAENVFEWSLKKLKEEGRIYELQSGQFRTT